MKRIAIFMMIPLLLAALSYNANAEDKPTPEPASVTEGHVIIYYPEGWQEISTKLAKDFNAALVKTADKFGIPNIISVNFIIKSVSTEAEKQKGRNVHNTIEKAVQGEIYVTEKDKDYQTFIKSNVGVFLSLTALRNKVTAYVEDKCHLTDYGVRWFFEGIGIYVADETMKAFYGKTYRSPVNYADAWFEAAKEQIFFATPSCKGFRPEIRVAWLQFYREMTEKYGADKVAKFYPTVKAMKSFSAKEVIAVFDKITGGDCVKFCKEYKVKRKYASLGVDINPAYKDGDGVEVRRVTEGSSAEEGGMQAEDLIVAINGKPIKNPIELSNFIRDTKVGDKIEVTVLRVGGKPTLTITLKERVFSIGFDTCTPPPEEKKTTPKDETTPEPNTEPNPE